MVDALLPQLVECGIPAPLLEFRFHPTRKWRFDMAWPERRIALECEGGVYISGRHVRGQGYENDCRKYSEAAILGWRIIRITPKMIKSGEAVDYVIRVMATPPAES